MRHFDARGASAFELPSSRRPGTRFWTAKSEVSKSFILDNTVGPLVDEVIRGVQEAAIPWC